MRNVMLLALFSVAVILALGAPVAAKPTFLNHLKATYGLGEAAKCFYCHDVAAKDKPSKKNLGAFGKDYQKALAKYGKDNLDAVVKSLESLDSDGDGATNIEELRLGTKPGDATSTPTKELLEKYRKANPAAEAKK